MLPMCEAGTVAMQVQECGADAPSDDLAGGAGDRHVGVRDVEDLVTELVGLPGSGRLQLSSSAASPASVPTSSAIFTTMSSTDSSAVLNPPRDARVGLT